jgi:hypothetical protein
MLALVRSSVWPQVWKILLLSCAAAALASCATKESPLISDPSASRETALPWNEQQKWEREGQAAAVTQQRR